MMPHRYVYKPLATLTRATWHRGTSQYACETAISHALAQCQTAIDAGDDAIGWSLAYDAHGQPTEHPDPAIVVDIARERDLFASYYGSQRQKGRTG